MSSQLWLVFVDIYHCVNHFKYTFSHAHIGAHTHKHTCMISSQEEWQKIGTGAWLGGVEEDFLQEEKS